MERSPENYSKLMKVFAVAGIDENNISKYSEIDFEQKFVNSMDIISLPESSTAKNEKPDESWIQIDPKKNFWLRIEFSTTYFNPITYIKFIDCEYDENDPTNLLIKKSHIDQGFHPIMVTYYDDEEIDNISDEICDFVEKDKNYFILPSYLNVKHIFNPHKAKPSIIALTRDKDRTTIKDISIIKDKHAFKLGLMLNKEPQRFKYLPEILDCYPNENNLNPGIAMFCFPEGVSIYENLISPKSFSFILTDELGNISYGTCLVIVEEISSNFKDNFVPVLNTQKKFFVEKALFVIGHKPFLTNYREYLKELYRIQNSATEKPLERIICHFIDSIYLPLNNKLRYSIGNKELEFYSQPEYGYDWDINDSNLEVLFSKISIENILIIWEALLLERKTFILCKSKALLTDIFMAFLSLMNPFKWEQALIPILPEKLRVFIDAPVPLFVGICFKTDLNEFPPEAIIFDADTGKFEKYCDKMPKLPQKIISNLTKKLEKFKAKFNNAEDRIKLENYDDAYNLNFDIGDSKHSFNTFEIRDSFYEFFICLFKNFEKYFKIKDKKEKVFVRDLFLKDLSSTDSNSFLSKFMETMSFQNFLEKYLSIENNNTIKHFFDCIKKYDKKKDKFLIRSIPDSVKTVPEVSLAGLQAQKYRYIVFPKLNPDLFIKIDIPRRLSTLSKFTYTMDEWSYDIKSLSCGQWVNYLTLSVYEMWFQFFSFIISIHNDKFAYSLLDFAIFLLKDLTEIKKIQPPRSLYLKLIRACARPSFSNKVNEILNLMPINYRSSNQLYQNAFMDGIYRNEPLTESTDEDKILRKTSVKRISLPASFENNHSLAYEIMNEIIFHHYDICPKCVLLNKIKRLYIDEILAGFKKDNSSYYSLCFYCSAKFTPKIYLINKKRKNDFFDTVNMLSPAVLMKEMDILIRNRGEKYLYSKEYYLHKDYKHIFWNIVYYFNLFKLPNFVLTVEKSDENIKEIENEFINFKQFHRSIKSLSIEKFYLKDKLSSTEIENDIYFSKITENIKNNPIYNSEIEKVEEEKNDLMNNHADIFKKNCVYIDSFLNQQWFKIGQLYNVKNESVEQETELIFKEETKIFQELESEAKIKTKESSLEDDEYDLVYLKSETSV